MLAHNVFLADVIFLLRCPEDSLGDISHVYPSEDDIMEYRGRQPAMDQILESTTLQDLAERQKKKEQPEEAMYYV